MIELISQGAGFGFAAGTIFGPLHTFLVNETIIGGWRRSIIIVLTPLIADFPLILLMVFVLDRLPDSLIRLLQVVGAMFILTLARSAWIQSNAEQVFETEAPVNARRFTLSRALLLSWLNPAPYIFWGTVLGPLLVEALEKSIWHGTAFLVSFYGVFLGIMSMVALIFDRLRHLDERFIRGVMKVSAVILVLFSLRLLAEGFGLF